MHKDNCFQSGEYQVWNASKVPVMKAVAEAQGMQASPDNHFRFCVFPPNACHHAASRSRINDIRRQSPVPAEGVGEQFLPGVEARVACDEQLPSQPGRPQSFRTGDMPECQTPE